MWERRHWKWPVTRWEPVADAAVPAGVIERWNLWARNGINCDQVPAIGTTGVYYYRFLFCV